MSQPQGKSNLLVTAPSVRARLFLKPNEWRTMLSCSKLTPDICDLAVREQPGFMMRRLGEMKSLAWQGMVTAAPLHRPVVTHQQIRTAAHPQLGFSDAAASSGEVSGALGLEVNE